MDEVSTEMSAEKEEVFEGTSTKKEDFPPIDLNSTIKAPEILTSTSVIKTMTVQDQTSTSALTTTGICFFIVDMFVRCITSRFFFSF